MPASHTPVIARRRTLRSLAGAAWATASLLGLSSCAVSVPSQIQPVTGFDIQQYAGQWYEIARIDHRFERGLINTSARYTVQDNGSVHILNRGFNPDKQTWKETEGYAKFLGDSNVAALKVSFFGPFYGGYNVISLDPDYQVALVVGQDTSYFWLLARDKRLPAHVIKQQLRKAAAAGVDMNQVILVKHE